MSAKEAVFNFKLEPELRAEFMKAAEQAHRPAAQILRELMREFVLRQQNELSYEAFMAQKAAVAQRDIEAKRLISNEKLNTEFTARKAAIGQTQ